MDRHQVLSELQRRIAEAGGTLVTRASALAAELGMKPERLYYYMDALEKQGQIETKRRGPRGTEFRLGSGQPPAGGPAPGRARGAAPRTARRSRGRAAYCPMCGRKAGADWRYCAQCGQLLPDLR